jgi:SOS response associated peptidase (SRAP)
MERRGPRQHLYYSHPKSHQFVAFAGLDDVWTKPHGEDLPTVTIITKDADAFVSRLHTRMPVMLAQDAEHAWLERHLTAPQGTRHLLERRSAGALAASPVSHLVNQPSVESKALIQRVESPSATTEISRNRSPEDGVCTCRDMPVWPVIGYSPLWSQSRNVRVTRISGDLAPAGLIRSPRIAYQRLLTSQRVLAR